MSSPIPPSRLSDSACSPDGADGDEPNVRITPGGEGETRTRKASKGKARAEGYGFSPISLLPLELLAHVFAHLPPHALGTCQLVCKGWHDVVGDEASWRNAFETYYSVTPESLGRRLEPSSWRSEYIARVSLLRQWHRSRTATVIHNPSLGAISLLHVTLPAPSALPLPISRTPSRSADATTLSTTTLLSVSLDLGAAVHSTPFTGKVSRRPLLSSPIDHLGRPLGLPIVAATSAAVSPDGTRLVWGMRDGSLRFSNSSPAPGGRGIAGGAVEQGEVRALEAGRAHREGTAVQLVAFSGAGGTGGGKVVRGVKQRGDVFLSAGADGTVAIWSMTVPPVAGAAVGERPPPAVKVWQARWDVALDAAPAVPASAGAAADGPARPRVNTTAVAFDAGWLGRHHGRPASVAVGRSDGKVVVWPAIELDDDRRDESPAVLEPVVLEPQGQHGKVDLLTFDPAVDSSSSLALLAHRADAASFLRYVFPSSPSVEKPPTCTTFGHPLADHLSSLTAFAVDFDPPPSATSASIPATPAEGKVSFPARPFLPTPSASSSQLSLPSLSRQPSEFSLSLPVASAESLGEVAGSRFGRRKYVAAGDRDGRVFLWDWETKQGEAEHERGDVVEPAAQVQGLEIDGGGSASKVTALEIMDVGVFVGGLDGTLRFYSTLGPSHLLSPPIRSFRDRTAPRHPSRLLAQGLVPDDEEERWLVSQVRASRDAVVAAIGGRVLAWRLSEEVKRKGPRASGGKLTARQERFKANLELQHQVRESISAISIESAARLEAHEDAQRRASEFGLPPSLGNMTEEEAVAFATMLSLDDQEASMFDERSRDGDWEHLPEDWLDEDALMLDEDYDRRRASTSGTAPALETEDEDDYADRSRTTSRGQSRSQSLSTSLTVPTSPFMRGGSLPLSTSPSASPHSFSRTWTPVSPSLRALGSPPSSFNPHGKLQISPRLGPTYGSQGALFVNEAVPDMSPELWPVAQSPASPPSGGMGSRRASTAGPSPLATSLSPSLPALPAPVPAVSSAQNGSTTTPVRRGWSDVARSTPSGSASASTSVSPSPSLRPTSAQRSPTASSSPPAWPSPAIGASWTPPPKATASSLLAEQLRYSERSAREEGERRRREREQEELDLAIALSLSEEAGGIALASPSPLPRLSAFSLATFPTPASESSPEQPDNSQSPPAEPAPSPRAVNGSTTPSLAERFPDLAFSSGVPSKLFSFDWDGGVDEAYELLGIDKGEEADKLAEKLGVLIHEELQRMASLPRAPPSDRLGAALVIASLRASALAPSSSTSASPREYMFLELVRYILTKEIIFRASSSIAPIPLRHVPGAATASTADPSLALPLNLHTPLLAWTSSGEQVVYSYAAPPNNSAAGPDLPLDHDGTLSTYAELFSASFADAIIDAVLQDHAPTIEYAQIKKVFGDSMPEDVGTMLKEFAKNAESGHPDSKAMVKHVKSTSTALVKVVTKAVGGKVPPSKKGKPLPPALPRDTKRLLQELVAARAEIAAVCEEHAAIKKQLAADSAASNAELAAIEREVGKLRERERRHLEELEQLREQVRRAREGAPSPPEPAAMDADEPFWTPPSSPVLPPTVLAKLDRLDALEAENARLRKTNEELRKAASAPPTPLPLVLARPPPAPYANAAVRNLTRQVHKLSARLREKTEENVELMVRLATSKA